MEVSAQEFQKQYTSQSRFSHLDQETKVVIDNIQDQMLQTHFSKVMDVNDRYLKHLEGDCICGRCTCGQCKCPKMLISLDFKKGQESLYQKEFAQRQRAKEIPLPDHNATYKSQLPMDMNTIQRTTFQGFKNVKPVQSYKPEQRVFVTPFASASSYQLNYCGNTGTQSINIKPPFHPTVVDMPMNITSSYQSNFYKKPIPKEEFLLNANKSSFKNPISPELPFLHQSQNHRFYKPYQTGKLERDQSKKAPELLPAFEGQFTSTTQNDFNGKDAKKCPSRLYLNQIYKQTLQAI